MATFNGTSDADIYTGGSENDWIDGASDNDKLSGGGGNDIISGGSGADSLSGGEGDDQLSSSSLGFIITYPLSHGVSFDIDAEVDTLVGGSGDDYFFAGYRDNVDGGTQGSFGNRLFISFQGATSGVNADFRLLHSQDSIVIDGATITNIQNIGYLEGSNYDDFLAPIDTYYPSGGPIFGRGGNDTIIADYYAGWGEGIWGGDGDDDIDATGAQYGPEIHGEAGNDIIRMGSGLGDIAYGGDGDDTISGGGTIYAGSGNDVVILAASYYGTITYGEDGDDEIRGAADGNAIAGGDGADTLTGGEGIDTLVSGSFTGQYDLTSTYDIESQIDQLTGGGGNDLLSIGYGDVADGGSGIDGLRLSLAGATSGVSIDLSAITGSQPFTGAGGSIVNIERLERLGGSSYADIIIVGTQSELVTIDGGAGDDVITSSNSSVQFSGGTGADRFVSGVAGDHFDGGDGFDAVDYRQAIAGVTVTLALTAGGQGSGAGGDVLVLVEQVLGSSLADTIVGSNSADALIGNEGNDSLTGNSGADTLEGGVGNDTMGGGGGGDRMAGGAGNDSYTVDNVLDNVIEVVGEGSDTVTATASWTLATGQEIELVAAIDGTSGIALTGNELGNGLTGNDGANALLGLAGGDTLVAGGGDDALDGGTGNDEVLGGAGQDVEIGGEGADTLLGNDGNDHLYGQSSNGGPDAGDWIDAGDGSDYIQGNAGNDTLDGGEGSDRINGGADDDLIGGSAGHDTFNGNLGNDTIEGGNGNDSLRGGQGNDSIEGGNGYDVLMGDLGSDRLSGGADNDIFRFSGQSSLQDSPDSITDFAAGHDRLSLGFAVRTVIVGSAQSNLAAATALAQQLLDSHEGAREVAAIGVGSSTYLFYSSSGGDLVDSAILVEATNPNIFGRSDFI